ncbi:hypothetical protein IWW39_002142 [Coemansia spiralis]|uniref:F-box domain-containing protein n=1 Tax=Coemansia spiralis TaxID=417178 RepID=A0A9W8GNQ7_9FUNG|nr:hypothetical protein IWW39_002142 [Coemansia spiralis]
MSSPDFYQLPFDVLLAICAQLPPCACVERGDYTRALGCSRDHAPGAFGATELSALRQTSRAWRAAALGQGLRVVVASSRWMHGGNGTRLAAIRRYHGQHVRRLVFRSSDAYHSGRHRAGDSVCAELEAALELKWPSLAAVAVDWFGSSPSDHIRIATAVRHSAPRIRDFYLRDKAASVAQIAPLLGSVSACLTRLTILPYGFNQNWAALQPSERGAAAAVRRMAGQLTLLAVGGSDVTPELLEALHATQPRLRTLQIEHACVGSALRSAPCLRALTTLRLEHVMVGTDGVLPLSPAALPSLTTLSVRHVWRPADRPVDSVRGAVSLQNDRWLVPLWSHRWSSLRVLALPAIADADAQALPHACPNLARLVTHSLDYAGPRLSAAGLVCLLSRLPRLTHLAVEQRRADGSPGYSIAGATLCRLLGCADDDARFGDRMLSRMSPPASPNALAGCSPPPPSALNLRALCIPNAEFTAPALDTLVHQLPSLSFLSVTLRSDSLFAGDSPPRPHLALRRLALRADEDVLADPLWLSAWLAQRFPALRECSTNHARSHRQTVAELRALAPAVSFTRLSSRALQTTCN